MVVKNQLFDKVVQVPNCDYETQKITMAEGDVYVIKCWGHESYGKINVIALLDGGQSDAEALAMVTSTSCVLPIVGKEYHPASLTFIDLDSTESITQEEAKALTDIARNVVRSSKRFTIIDRESYD